MKNLNVLFDEKKIAERVAELGRRITEDYRDCRREIMIVGVLKGSFVFLADLCRAIDLPLKVGFMALSSYGDETKSSGAVRLESDLGFPIKDKHVIVVEDIVDTGLTLQYLLNNLQARHPASLRLCSLLEKPDCKKVEVLIDYLGFQVPDDYVVGYGLDAAQLYRNLPYIAILDPNA